MNRFVAAACALLCVSTLVFAQATPDRPFSDQSPWNSRPTKVTLGDYEIPKLQYFPLVAEGAYSVHVAIAKPTDPPMTVVGETGKPGIYIADAEMTAPQVTITHWPADVVPAKGGDGHADIIDPSENRIHSFYRLRQVNGRWVALQYTWSALDGRGWGDPAHYFQGSRAAGVPTTAGIIRTSELRDGKQMYDHALAMSLPYEALAPKPAFIYPATAADIDAAQRNHGVIPEGALMVLPTDFDIASIKNPDLLKIVRTLQKFGAYVVDANFGTPFALYVEIGSDFHLMPPGTWVNGTASELDRIRAALRQVVAVSDWVDAKGKPFVPNQNMNLLSLRGPWNVISGTNPGTFDSWQQAIVFPPNGGAVVQTNTTSRTMKSVDWANPREGDECRLSVSATEGASLRLALLDATGKTLFDSGALKDASVANFKWPRDGAKPVVTVASGSAGGGHIKVTLITVNRVRS